MAEETSAPSEQPDRDLRAGERRTVTIVFSDMKDFSDLSERLDPEEVDNLMTTVFGGFESIVRRHDGTVEKYIGDALVAVFGATKIHEDDANRAIDAALGFQDEIRRINRTIESRGISLSFRTGIHTGLITTGKRGKFDVVTGHAMSIASRLQSAAPPTAILVSDATRGRCEQDFIFSDRAELELKGAEEPVISYRVRGRSTGPLRDYTGFVGRENVLADMVRAYLKFSPQTSSGFFVSGEGGVGKTSLVARFVARIRQLPDFDSAVLYARGQRFRNMPFAVITDLIANYLRLDPSAAEAQIIEAVSTRLQVEERTAQEFASLVLGSDQATAGSQSFVHLYMLVKSILGAHEESPYPSVVFVDNVASADRQSRDFFQFFLKNATSIPFFVLTDRAADAELLGLFNNPTQIRLAPLDREETYSLIRKLLPDTVPVDAATLQSVFTNSNGNPLFVHEYVRYYVENKDVSQIPSTIQNIFLASIENFDTPVKDLLRKLSVFFHSFSRDDAVYIQEHTDSDPSIVDGAIDNFLGQGLIVQAGTIYQFRHDVFKKAVYNTLLNYNKRILHRLVANRMRETGSPHMVRLLHHLTRAEDYEDARNVLMDARDRSVNPEYLRYIDLLLEKSAENDYDSKIQLLFAKSAILYNNGNTEDTDSILKRIIRVAVSQKNVHYIASAYHLLTAYNMKSYAFQKAHFCGTKALSYYDRVGERENAQANVIKIMSLSEILRNHLDESERLVRILDDERFSHQMDAISARAERSLLIGEYHDAARLLELSIEKLGERVDDHWLSIYFLAALSYWQLCDFDKLKENNRRLLQSGSRHNSNLSQVHSQLAVACHFTGEPEQVEQHLQQAEFYAYQIRNDFDLIDSLRTLTVSLIILGRTEKAERAAQEGLTIGLRHSAFYPTFSLLVALFEIHFNRAELANARFFMEEAAFYIKQGPLLANRDLILYNYYRYLLESADSVAAASRRPAETVGEPAAEPMSDTADGYLQSAVGLFEHEKSQIEQPELIANFLKLRSFGRIQKHIDATPQTSGTPAE